VAPGRQAGQVLVAARDVHRDLAVAVRRLRAGPCRPVGRWRMGRQWGGRVLNGTRLDKKLSADQCLETVQDLHGTFLVALREGGGAVQGPGGERSIAANRRSASHCDSPRAALDTPKLPTLGPDPPGGSNI